MLSHKMLAPFAPIFGEQKFSTKANRALLRIDAIFFLTEKQFKK